MNAPDGPGSGRLLGSIDQPTSGDTVSAHSAVVRGWAARDGVPALAVAVLVDGRVVGRALVGNEARPDVAEVTGSPGLEASGWMVEADLTGCGGSATVGLVVVVFPDAHSAPVALDPVTVAVDRAGPAPGPAFLGRLESPSPDLVLDTDVVSVSGWIVSPTTAIRSADLLVNGVNAGRVRLGIPRPDVAALDARPLAAVAGFEHVADLRRLPPDEPDVTLQLVARALGGDPLVALEESYRRRLPAASTPGPPGAFRAALPAVASPAGSGRRLDLVVFHHHLGLGGAQLWLSELLRRSGAGTAYPCTVISPYDGPLRPLFEGWGITVRLTQPYPTDTPGSYEGRLAELAQVVIAGGHTAALVNTLLPTVGADLCGRLGIPTVWAIHESFDPGLFWSYALGGAPVPSWLPVRLHQALGATAALVFEAEATRRLFTPAAGPGRAVVVPYGIDVAGLRRYAASTDRAAARRALGIAPGRRMALVMGTMDARKAQIRIAEGFALVAREHPDWDLVFVGGDDRPYTAALERFVDESDLADRVRVVPIVPDTSHWYRAADVMVSGSDVESLPRSALEAMGLGVPVLATAVFGLPELIEDGVTGFLVEPGDLQALVDGFRRVCSLPAGELAAVGDAARELIVAAYDSGGYAADIVALLEHLVDHPRADPSAFLAGRPPRGRRRGPTPAGPATAW